MKHSRRQTAIDRRNGRIVPLTGFRTAPTGSPLNITYACNDGAQNEADAGRFVVIDGQAYPVVGQPPQNAAIPSQNAAGAQGVSAPPPAPPAPPQNGVAGGLTIDRVNEIVASRINTLNAQHEADRAKLQAERVALYKTLGIGGENQPKNFEEYQAQQQQRQLQTQIQNGDGNAVVETLQRQLEEAKRASQTEAQTLRQQLADQAINVELAKYATKTAHPEHVMQLLRNSLRYNEATKTVEVIDQSDPNAGARLDGHGGVLSVGAYVDDWLKANPIYQPASHTGPGSGSHPNASGSTNTHAGPVVTSSNGQGGNFSNWVERSGGNGVDVKRSFDAMCEHYGLDNPYKSGQTTKS